MGGCSSNQKDTSKIAVKTSPKIQKLEEVRVNLFCHEKDALSLCLWILRNAQTTNAMFYVLPEPMETNIEATA